MKILLLSLLFVIGGQITFAEEVNSLDVESCGVLYSSSIRVKQCTLLPDTDRLLECGAAMRKLAKQQNRAIDESQYLDYASKAEAKAQEAWDKGEKIMLAKRTPNSEKQICGYYLNCLKTYVEALPVFAPDGRLLRDESFDVKKRYGEIRAFCAKGAYTLTTGIRKVEEKSPSFKRWRGKDTPRLSRITIQESKQVIFIDPKSGEVINVPLPDSATSSRTSEKYVFDSHKCIFELKEEDESDKHINTAPVYVFSTDGKGRPQRDMKFTNNTDLNFKINHIEPIIQINWNDIETFEPTFHKASKYISKNVLLKESPMETSSVLKKVMTMPNMVAARTLLNPFRAIDSKELCDMKMAEEFLRGTVIWRASEKVVYDYDIDFRPAEKWERAKALKIIKRMKNWSGSYTEEKQIYDGLNSPFRTTDYKGQKRESYNSIEKSNNTLNKKSQEDDMSEKEKREVELWKETEDQDEIFDRLEDEVKERKRNREEREFKRKMKELDKLEQNPNGILDTLVPQDKGDDSDEISMDDLEMFTN